MRGTAGRLADLVALDENLHGIPAEVSGRIEDLAPRSAWLDGRAVFER
ncbi:hypothetical protein [Streptomyces sp. NPDC052225]